MSETTGQSPVVDSAAAAATSGATVARGGLWEATGLILPQFYVFLVSAVMARQLGPSLFGRVILIATVQVAVTTIAMWGSSGAISRHVGMLLGANRGDELRSLFRWAYRVMAGFSVLAFCVMYGIAFALHAKPQDAWFFAGLTAAAAVLSSVASSFLAGAQRFRDARLVGVITGAVQTAAKVAALLAGRGIVVLFVIDFVIVSINLFGTNYLARRYLRPLGHATVTAGLKRSLVRFNAIAGITYVLNLVVYQRTEVFVLAHYRSDAEIARYTIPYALVATMLLLPMAVGSALTPAIATLWGAGDVRRIRSGVSRAVRLMTLVTIAMSGLAIAAGIVFVKVLYGSRYANVAPVLVVLALSLPFVPLGTISGSVLRSIGALKWPTFFGLIAAVANVALAFALIAPYGAIGAACANSLAQVIVAVPLIVYLGRKLGGIEFPWWTFAKGTIAVSVATVAAWGATQELPLAASFVAAPIIYAAITLVLGRLFGVLRPEDRAWLASVARGTMLRRPRLRRAAGVTG